MTLMGYCAQYGLIEFGTQEIHHGSAAHLVQKFDRASHGRVRWNQGSEKKGSYLWLARSSDLRHFGASHVDVVIVNRPWRLRMAEEYYYDTADTYTTTEDDIATRS